MHSERPSSGDQIPVHGSVVEVHVSELDQLFHTMDPSPFHEKALHPDAEEFIIAAARELPSGRPAALVVYLDKPVGLPDETRVIGDAVRRHFAREAQFLRWELRRLLRRGAVNLAIGLTVLAAALAGGDYLARHLGGHLAKLLGQSLHIGGYVAMWHPMEIFLYEWWPILNNRRLHERLSQIPVRIVHTRDADPRAQVVVEEMVGSAAAPPDVNGDGSRPRGV
jgi:hypothetical protein